MLARNPSEFFLISQKDGWIPLKDVYKALHEKKLFTFLTTKAIKQYLELFRPPEFQLKDEKIRARPDLVIPGLFSYGKISPPPELFYPFRPKAFEFISTNGIKVRQGEKWTLLFDSRKKALVFGKRIHNKPLVAKIFAKKAENNGIIFFNGGHGVFLVSQTIPVDFIEITPVTSKTDKKQKPEKKRKEEALNSTLKEKFLAGTFIPSPVDVDMDKLKRAERYKKKKGGKKHGKKRKRY